MAKTNFSKVEEALIEGLRKMQVSELLELADEAAGVGVQKDESVENRRMAALALGHALNWLKKKEPSLFKKLNVKKTDVDHYLKSEEKITDEEWEKVKTLQEEIHRMKEELFPNDSNEDLVAKERERHLKKRFNISEKWLPLD